MFFCLDTKEPKGQVSINLPLNTLRTPGMLTGPRAFDSMNRLGA